MRKQAFQHAEIRDENDNIVNNGAYGKNTALSNAQNDGWIDHVMNNLEYLYEQKSSVDTSNFVSRDEFTNATSGFASKSSLVGLATTAYVDGRIKHVVGTAPEALDTLGEIATALTTNKDKIGTIITEISTKADKGIVENALMGKATKEELAKKADKDAVYTRTESDERYQAKGKYVTENVWNDTFKKILNQATHKPIVNIAFSGVYGITFNSPLMDYYSKSDIDTHFQGKGDYLTQESLNTFLEMIYEDGTIKLPNGARIGVE